MMIFVDIYTLITSISLESAFYIYWILQMIHTNIYYVLIFT